jgi:hypothetical protein
MKIATHQGARSSFEHLATIPEDAIGTSAAFGVLINRIGIMSAIVLIESLDSPQ